MYTTVALLFWVFSLSAVCQYEKSTLIDFWLHQCMQQVKMRRLLISCGTSVSLGDAFTSPLFPGLSMYQVVQKKFNLCAVVVHNCFISPVDAVLCKVFFFHSWSCIALSQSWYSVCEICLSYLNFLRSHKYSETMSLIRCFISHHQKTTGPQSVEFAQLSHRVKCSLRNIRSTFCSPTYHQINL